jgi:hypothetical protein
MGDLNINGALLFFAYFLMLPPLLLTCLWILHTVATYHDYLMQSPSLLSPLINRSCPDSMFKVSRLLSAGCGIVTPAMDGINRICNHRSEWARWDGPLWPQSLVCSLGYLARILQFFLIFRQVPATHCCYSIVCSPLTLLAQCSLVALSLMV